MLNNGLLFPAAALAIILPLFLPIAVSVIGGDTIAGEASNGTLRYLLTRPVGRTHLLSAKLIAVITFIFLAVIVVALVALAAGVVLFGIRPLSSISATELSPFETFVRTVMAITYIGWSMLGLGAIALFASTRTDSPLAASLATLAAFVGSQVLDLIDGHRVDPGLPADALLAEVRRLLPRPHPVARRQRGHHACNWSTWSCSWARRGPTSPRRTSRADQRSVPTRSATTAA